MLKVKTLIKDINSNQNSETFFLSIENLDAIKLVEKTLKENENDYLEGAIVLKYNSDVILSEKMETTDLLYTWKNLVAPLLNANLQDTQYSISILDSLYDVELFVEQSIFRIVVSSPLIENGNLSYNIPKEDYSISIIDGFLTFAEFILKNDFTFTAESSYPSFINDYNKLIKMKNR